MRVAHVQRDVRAGPGAAGREHVREPGRSLVELGVGAAIGAADRRVALGDGVGDPLEQICEIELQRCPSARRYSPILT